MDIKIHRYVVLYLLLQMFLLQGCQGDDNCRKKSCTCRHDKFTSISGKTVCDGCIDGYTGDLCNIPCPSTCLNCSQTYYHLENPEQTCDVCKDGYYNGKDHRGGDKFRRDCRLQCKPGCDVCSSYNECNECKIKYYMHAENECKPCPAYCDICSSETTCDTCLEGFFWNDNLYCFPCSPNCKHCSSKTECSECFTQFYWDGNECKKCPSGCLSCKSSDYCHTCEKRYYIKDNQCKECTENCRRCSFSSLDNYTCQECHQGYYLSHGECHYCSKGCTQCTLSEKCLKCESHYYLDSGRCYLCPTECTSCSADNFCTACQDGYYRENGKCLRCLATCTVCTSKELCTHCTAGFYGDNCTIECPDNCDKNTCNKTTGRCNNCKDAFHFDKSGVCIKCPEHCLLCDSQTSCLTCADGFKGNVCEEICSSCAVGTKCDKSNGYCFQRCRDGLSGIKCDVKCDSKCLSCDRKNPIECKSCAHNRFGKFCNENCSVRCLNGVCNDADGFCLESCVDGYWGNTCENDCPLHCENNVCDRANRSCTMGCSENYSGSTCSCLNHCSCDSVDNCTLCKDGFFGNFCEHPCSEGCTMKQCNRTSGECFADCLAGYEGRLCTKVKEANADPYKETKDVNVGLISGLVPTIIVLPGTTIIAVVYVVRKRRRITKPRRRITKPRNKNKSTSDTYAPVPLYENTQPIERQSQGIFNRLTSALQIQIGTPRPHALTNSWRITLKTTPNNDIILHEIRTEDSPEVNASPKIDDTYYNTAAVKRRKIKVETLKTFVAGKSAKSFIDEFKELPDGLIYPYTESQKPENFKKNRYRGIYPYDKTRVVLKDGMPDYINASFVDGYNMCKAYIGCLGPTIQFMGDFSVFWRMVWQEKCGRIVMLTKLRESEVRKCDQYWPDKKGRASYGDIFVTCLEEQSHKNYTVRTFDIQKQGHDNRIVTHFHFTAWPDQGVPENVTSLVRFLQDVNNTLTELKGPTLVHCSAGVGRTGTYIALDMLTKEGETEGHVDIFACVRNLREQRVKMIQTIEQYEYLHHALVYSLQSKHHTMEIAV